MWIRSELKSRAKAVLKGTYWKAFLISLVIALAGGSGGGGGGGGGGRGGSVGSRGPGFADFDLTSALPVIIMSILAAGAILIAVIAIRIFLGYPLEVGGRRYFVRSSQYMDNKGVFRFAFDGRNYMGIVAAMFQRGIQNLLWYLLLIIPGIVKAYAYSMVPYILADNPNIGGTKAIKLSSRMTYGHKFDIFVLDLSFIVWFLLGVLALFVGTLFVLPYYNATRAELYLVLRRNALEKNFCSYEDLMPE